MHRRQWTPDLSPSLEKAWIYKAMVAPNLQYAATIDNETGYFGAPIRSLKVFIEGFFGAQSMQALEQNGLLLCGISVITNFLSCVHRK